MSPEAVIDEHSDESLWVSVFVFVLASVTVVGMFTLDSALRNTGILLHLHKCNTLASSNGSRHGFCFHVQDLKENDVLVPFDLHGQPWVLFRDATGNPACVQDECAHRACPLSIGKLVDGHVSCPYHGWKYDGNGNCIEMPSTVFREGISVKSLPVREKDGFIWAWTGTETPPSNELPGFAAVPDDFVILSEVEMTVKVEKGLLMSNLLDEGYIPSNPLFRHWFDSEAAQQGHWRGYSIDSLFQPPCSVTSILDVADSDRGEKRRRVYQLHVCLPVSDKEVRILQRISVNFWKWTSQLPIAQQIFHSMAAKEDASLATGQQERMEKAGLHSEQKPKQ